MPVFVPNNIYSFYPYPISSPYRVHQTLLGQTSSTSTASDSYHRNKSNQTARHEEDGHRFSRMTRRVLLGRRPAGMALGREAEELSEEEAALDNEKVLRQFPYRQESDIEVVELCIIA